MGKAQGTGRSNFNTQKPFSERVLQSIRVNQNVAGMKKSIRKEQKKEEEGKEEQEEERDTYTTPRDVTFGHTYATSTRTTPPSARSRHGVWRLDENHKWKRSAPEIFSIESP